MRKNSSKQAVAIAEAGDQPNYSERSSAMLAEEREAVQREAAKHYAALCEIVSQEKEMTSQMELISVRGVNAAREIGRQIELFTQRDKLQLAQFNSLAVALNDAPFQFAKECLATFRKFSAPVKSAEEAAETWKRIKCQLELLPKMGHGKQRAHPDEPIMDLLGVVIRVTGEAVAVQKKIPMTEWPDFQRDQFEKESKTMHDLHELAVEIRMKKNGVMK